MLDNFKCVLFNRNNNKGNICFMCINNNNNNYDDKDNKINQQFKGHTRTYFFLKQAMSTISLANMGAKCQ